MNPISTYIPTEIKRDRKNRVLDGFMEILNPPRVEKGMKPITYSRLGFLLKHLDDWDKAIFLGSCKDAQNPSSYFWWALKPE